MSQAWPNRRILDLFRIDLPLLLAPMAGSGTPKLAIAVGAAGGLAALPAAQYTPEQLDAAIAEMREALPGRPLNLNFFAHTPPVPDAAREANWRARLAPYFAEAGIDPATVPSGGGRAPFDEKFCVLVEARRPEVVSFHFGLPEPSLLARVKATGAKVISSATTVAEAKWLEEKGCDAIIAMGLEAGGHRGAFLDLDMTRQVGTFALVPQVRDAVSVPVIAAGGISDGRGVAAAFALGADAVQVGTAFLFSPEAGVAPLHRAALERAEDNTTALTNLFTGRPARGVMNRIMREIGPLSPDAPAFPLAGAALAPLKARAEADGRDDFTNLWSGQAARLAPRLPAGELALKLVADARALLGA
ncbi:putative dioxygenase [Azorhizobium caulinodans ORS 571]|uniref:Nitronate monooxygenase n=1 Tax=Azorhizobium caulinodans (strain ATCC 43989 / DSM 5975 / JCM 20966 / LMG 6465 / NBRC 14845 / NCIMB 13405 / ORS 571) TaxID=438753 RepID=A8I774_AZOC5|nr:nitronate monooxygenase family protein [Azorhizobium caulinodans]BAF88086.1 putative dioxygenase [Azorhizobium caulinodans ORS 571]